MTTQFEDVSDKLLEDIGEMIKPMLGTGFVNNSFIPPETEKCCFCEKEVKHHDAIGVEGKYACSVEHAAEYQKQHPQKVVHI